jgi:hypothetical protein
LKVGITIATILWPTRVGSGDPAEGVSEAQRLKWQAKGYLCAGVAAGVGACAGNLAFGVFVGGIVGNLVAQRGRQPVANLQQIQ